MEIITEALRKSEERYRILIEQSPIAIEIYNSEGLLENANQACLDLFGVSDYSQIKGFSLYDDPNLSDDIKNKLIQNNSIHYQVEFDFDKVKGSNLYDTTKSGKIYIDLIITKIIDSNGKISSYLLYIQDITEQKQNDVYGEMGRKILQILNESDPLLVSVERIVAELKSGTGVDAVGIRLKNGDDYPYLAYDGFSKQFMETENSLLERNPDGGLCRDKDGNVSLECTCGLVLSGKFDPANGLFTAGGSNCTNDSFLFLDLPLNEDLRHNPRNICIHHGYASVALIPIRAKDEIVGLFQLNAFRKGYFSKSSIEQLENIALHFGEALRRKQIEEEIRIKNDRIIALSSEEIAKKNKKLQELNETKDKFFSIIAHDLRSPFQGLLGMTGIFADDVSGFSSSELSEFAGKMNQSVKKLYHLIDNLLIWANIQKKDFTFNPDEHTLRTLVDEDAETIDNMLAQKGLTILNEVPGDFMVFADEKMINTILRNLLSNAVKFTRRGGRITVNAKETNEEMIEISVSDTGTGMSQADLNKLFKISEKMRREGTEGEPSTGLGLLLCKEFVEKQGGKIWAASKEGTGSTFYFTVKKSRTKR